MHFLQKAWFVLVLVTLVLSACGQATPQPDEVNTMLTEGVGTMVAAFFGTQTAMFTPATPTFTPTQTPIQTPTPFSTFTPFPSLTPTFVYYTPTLTRTPGTPTVTGTVFTPTVNNASLAYGCNNLGFIRDVTIPPGTVLGPNEDFTKTWKVQNTGSCDWMYQYQLALVSGDGYGAGSFRIQERVPVWSWNEFSVSMTTPRRPGTYTNYWRLMDFDGHLFGDTLVVSFTVAEPTAVPPTAAPTGVTPSPDATTSGAPAP